MNTIHVNSLPIREVIQDFARAFGTEFSEHCDQYIMQLPEAWGEGYIKGVNFEGGLAILEYACKFKEELEIHFVIDKIHPLKYLFCLEGTLKHRFANKDARPHVLEQYQNSIVASEKNNGHILNFSKNQFTDIYSLEIDRKVFKNKMLCDISHSKPKLQAIFQDDEALKRFYYKGLYSLILALMFQEMKDFEHNGLIKKIFLEGKAFQILASQLIQYDDDDKEESSRNLLRKSEVKSVLEAIAIIEDEMDYLGSVQSIAHRVGLNGNKIQDGFKSLYGLTVNGYIQKSRLDVAKNLLLKTNLPIQEVMEKVGWTNKSYFSKIFKDNFNHSPSEFRKFNNKANSE